MKIGIIGGGAVGLLFAAHLGKTCDVSLYVKRVEQKEWINSKGIILKEENSVTPVKASDSLEFIEKNDLIIVAVKQYHLTELRETLKKIPSETPMLFLQNGIGHLELLQSLRHQNIFVGTVEHGSLKINDNTVGHKGKGKTNTAVFRGSDKMLYLLKQESGDFPFHIQPDYEAMLLKKLGINAVINPLTAVLGIQNGQLIDNPFFLELARAVYMETLLLYPEMKTVITFDDIKAIAANTYENTSSMLADIKAKRETEIDAILGVMVDKAAEEHIPLSLIPLLYSMIKGLDNERRTN